MRRSHGVSVETFTVRCGLAVVAIANPVVTCSAARCGLSRVSGQEGHSCNRSDTQKGLQFRNKHLRKIEFNIRIGKGEVPLSQEAVPSAQVSLRANIRLRAFPQIVSAAPLITVTIERKRQLDLLAVRRQGKYR